MTLTCAACGEPGPPFHVLNDCPVVKERQRPRDPPELGSWDGKVKSDARGEIRTRTPRLTVKQKMPVRECQART